MLDAGTWFRSCLTVVRLPAPSRFFCSISWASWSRAFVRRRSRRNACSTSVRKNPVDKYIFKHQEKDIKTFQRCMFTFVHLVRQDFILEQFLLDMMLPTTTLGFDLTGLFVWLLEHNKQQPSPLRDREQLTFTIFQGNQCTQLHSFQTCYQNHLSTRFQ